MIYKEEILFNNPITFVNVLDLYCDIKKIGPKNLNYYHMYAFNDPAKIHLWHDSFGLVTENQKIMNFANEYESSKLHLSTNSRIGDIIDFLSNQEINSAFVSKSPNSLNLMSWIFGNYMMDMDISMKKFDKYYKVIFESNSNKGIDKSKQLFYDVLKV
jgi:hypothetical protein